MLPKQATRKNISLLMVIVSVVGGLITLPTIQSIEAAINIGQTETQTNVCGLFFTPVLCTNSADNTATITPAPVATQNIDVTGTQNIDQTNTCDDDDQGRPGAIECLNQASFSSGFPNQFVLEHDQAADVIVESFEQDILQENNCLLFDRCHNLGGNTFAITAQDDDGVLATGTDVAVESSIQKVDQSNDCDGNIASVEPDPSCFNIVGNFLGLSALGDGDINLGKSTQSAQQENVCVDGSVQCINSGQGGTLLITSDGSDAEVTLDSNSQQVSQGNGCKAAGTICNNFANNIARLNTLEQAEVDFDDNTQTAKQTNLCDNTGAPLSICANSGFSSNFVLAEDDSTIEGSNLQQHLQSNACTDLICSNAGNNINQVVSQDTSNIESDTAQTNIQSNKGTSMEFTESRNAADNTNIIFASNDAEVDSDTEQSNTQANDCSFIISCLNTGNNNNVERANGDSELTAENGQSNKQTNTCTDGFCDNVGSNSKETFTADPSGQIAGQAELDSESDQTNKQVNDCDVSDCGNNGRNNVKIAATDEANVNADNDQSNDQNNDCDGGSRCDNTNDNTVNINADNEDEVDIKTDQKSKQDNSCNNGASCSNSGSSSVNIGQAQAQEPGDGDGDEEQEGEEPTQEEPEQEETTDEEQNVEPEE